MADPIILPKLPHPVMNAMLGDDWADLFTADQLRARDLEIVRLMLEGAKRALVQASIEAKRGTDRAVLTAAASTAWAAHWRYATMSNDIKPAACGWSQDSDSYSDTWATSCGHYFRLDDGTPTDNKMAFCCYCGKSLVSYPFVEDEDE